MATRWGTPSLWTDCETLLNATFDEWIGRRGRVEWPPHSPDLTPMDFSVWDILKNAVYSVKIHDVEPVSYTHLDVYKRQVTMET